MGKLQFLKTDQDFAAFKSSKLFTGKFLKIRVRYLSNQNPTRFGFIVPKKVLPRVVDRNLVKRRIKSLLQKMSAQIKPVEVLFFPDKQSSKQSFQKLSEEVTELFTKANLWK